MIRKIIIPLFLIMISCNSPVPPADTAKPEPASKPGPVKPEPKPNPWIIGNYVDAGGEPTNRKYARLDATGTFSDLTLSDANLHVVILLNKGNAGILLHELKKSNPAEKFTGQVLIKMKNPDGDEIELTSSRGWNKAGGILIEQNNNDYSRFRIFMLQSSGVINAEVYGDSSSVYRFDINAAGFGDALSQI